MNRVLLFASCLSAPILVSTAAWAQRAEPSVGDALLQPLRDLSILRPEPEEVLQRASIAPYAIAPTLPDGALDCTSVAGEIELLDAALGADVDVANALGMNLMAQARTGMADALVDAVGDLVDLPYRGVIRWISGAERRDREMQYAVQAGTVRRAFLKGLSARECAELQLHAVLEPMPEAPLSDLELAWRQLAAANAAAAAAELRATPAASEPALAVAVTGGGVDVRLSDLELARRQLAAANGAAAASEMAASRGAGETVTEVSLATGAGEIRISDLELARRQLAEANAAAVAAELSAPETALEVTLATGGADGWLSDLELARRQLAAANAAAAAAALSASAGGDTAQDAARGYTSFEASQ
ncbi:MAG: hypothetical protein AB7H66_06505 [Hyphomonadaceae bacterium]